MAKIDDRWEIEDALRTLNRAEEIKRDNKMMQKVGKLAQDQIKSLQKHVPASQKNALIVDGKRPSARSSRSK